MLGAPSRVISSRVVAAQPPLQAYCEVRAYVWPQVQLYLWMPLDSWSGRFVGIGCGGACGVIERIDATHLWRPMILQGDVAMFTDMGHTGRDTTDFLWAMDNAQAQIDFGFRATHVATLAGKAISEVLYDRAVSRAYFLGNSTGGRQGLIEAQRFPADYQGIVAKCPAIYPGAADSIIWTLQSLSDRDGHPLLDGRNAQRLDRGVRARCDKLDGVGDGVVSDPRRCDFNPEEVSCERDSSAGCLNPSQLAGVKRAYLGPPATADGGERHGLPKGSESIWKNRYVSDDQQPTSMWDFMMNWLRTDQPVWEELRRQGAAVSLADYDVARFRDVRGDFQLMQEASNPDLEGFAARGGKMILMQGQADVIIPPSQTTHYYETAVRTAGGLENTRKFFRYFIMPGVGHCFSGDGTGADVFDSYASIVSWVEGGQAPERILAQKLSKYHGLFPELEIPAAPDIVLFSRPLYPYPERSAYRGRGDPRRAESFTSKVDK